MQAEPYLTTNELATALGIPNSTLLLQIVRLNLQPDERTRRNRLWRADRVEEIRRAIAVAKH